MPAPVVRCCWCGVAGAILLLRSLGDRMPTAMAAGGNCNCCDRSSQPGQELGKRTTSRSRQSENAIAKAPSFGRSEHTCRPGRNDRRPPARPRPRRSAEHGPEYGDEKLRIAKLHATMTINGLQRKNRVATAERGSSNQAANRGGRTGKAPECLGVRGFANRNRPHGTVRSPIKLRRSRPAALS